MSFSAYVTIGLVVAALALVFIFKHDIIKSEDDKGTVASDTVLLQAEDKKNEIRNVPISDARTANRLLSGTYFSH